MRPHFLAVPLAAAILGSLAAISPATQPAAAQSACDPHYDGVCLPVFSGTDNINCGDAVVTLSSFPAREPDPYKLDSTGVGDGIACEGNGKPAYQAPAPTATATSVPPTATATATSPAAATATPTSPAATATSVAPTSTATSAPPTATATTPPTTATTAPATATTTRTTVIPGPPNTGTGNASGPSSTSFAALAAIGLAISVAGAAAIARKR